MDDILCKYKKVCQFILHMRVIFELVSTNYIFKLKIYIS